MRDADSGRRMTNLQYQQTQDALFRLAKNTFGLNLDGLLRRINLVHTAAISNPDGYKKASEKLMQIERLARAAVEFRSVALEVTDGLRECREGEWNESGRF